MVLKWIISIAVVLLAYKFNEFLILNDLYNTRIVSLGLEPHGSGDIKKDFFAYLLVSIPGIRRSVTNFFHHTLLQGALVNKDDTNAALEGFHPAQHSSKFFAENFYTYATIKNDTSFVLTTRLSFYSYNASHVIPWFTFSYKGEEWNLPDEFEDNCHPYKYPSKVKECNAPGIGKLLFDTQKPMGKWVITYDGIVQHSKTGKRAKVSAKFNLDFIPDNVFFYQVHWDPFVAARSMAQKPWNQRFWHELRSQNQERYASQATKVDGKITFLKDEKNEEKIIDLPQLESSRDHNFGVRNWLYIWRYIWWSPVKFDQPIVINNIKYTYIAGSFVEYGNTFEDLIVGGIMSDDGHCASFSGATPMKVIAPEWYEEKSPVGVGIGETTLPSKFHFFISILQGEYVLEIFITRGTKEGLWTHSFMMNKGTFEIHEGQSLWTFVVRKFDDKTKTLGAPLQTTYAVGLFEFGANLVGISTEE